MIKKILALVLGILALLAVLVWINGFDDYTSCLGDSNKNNDECLKAFLMKSPPIQEVKELESACDETDSECFIKLGQKVIEEKITN